jgi:hypothetical protein
MPTPRFAISLLAFALGAPHAAAVTDDLQCFKVKNLNLKGLRGIVDLDAPSIGVAPGCKLTKAKLYCVPASTTVRPDTLFDRKEPLSELPVEGPPAETARICYGVKCKSPVGTAPDQLPFDKLGEHQFGKLKTSLLCTAASEEGVVPTGFQINTPSIELAPGMQGTYCYAFRTPNNHTTAIKAWTSEMLNVARMVMVFTSTEQQAPGTLSTSNCGLFGFPGGGPTPGAWIYAATTPDATFQFPADDGTGTALGQIVPGNQPGFLWMHVVNPTSAPVTAHVKVVGTEYDPGATVTRADSYVAYNGNLNIPPGSTDTETQTCNVPAGAKFISMTTHSNKQSTHTYVKDGATTLFEGTDFLNPGVRYVGVAPFDTFASGQLTYQCDYFNPGTNTIQTGESVATDETCIAFGFFFPSTKHVFCYNNFVVPF